MRSGVKLLPIMVVIALVVSSKKGLPNTTDEVELAHGHFLKELAILKLFPNSVSPSCIDSIQHLTKEQGRNYKERSMVRDDILKTLYASSIEICYPDVETICRINQQNNVQTVCKIFFQSL